MAKKKTVSPVKKGMTKTQVASLQKKWEKEDEKFWKEQRKKEIQRLRAHIAKLKMLSKTNKLPLVLRLIASNEKKLKKLIQQK